MCLFKGLLLHHEGLVQVSIDEVIWVTLYHWLTSLKFFGIVDLVCLDQSHTTILDHLCVVLVTTIL